MSTSAIVMMIVSMLIIWGGLVGAILNLRRSAHAPTEGDFHRDL